MLKDYEKIRKLDYKKDFTLKNIQEILALLGNPEKSLKIIHIAGTKGKTSTAYYISKLLEISGLKKIGLYTSPHLISPTERIQISSQPISEPDLKLYFLKVETLAEQKKITLTYFEVMTAAAFLYFKDQNCDSVVLETGLGGRLDATNVVFTQASVITTLDKDHTAVLGNNRFKIAFEKLGILKVKTPFLLGKQKFFVYLFCRMTGFLKKAQFIKNLKFKTMADKNYYQLENKHYVIHFYGPLYGKENFILALSAAHFLKLNLPAHFDFHHQVPGRFESYPNGDGIILLDGAHNPIAALKLKKSLISTYPLKKWHFVFNTFPDKDFKGMIDEFKSIAVEFIVIDKPEYAGDDIFTYLTDNKIASRKLKIEELQIKTDENYCITGSFYLAGDFKNKLLNKV